MKKRLYLMAGLLLLMMFAFAQEKDLYEYNNIINRLNKVQAPVVTEKYIIFTQATGPRFAGIAFDFENYNTIHSFFNHINTDIDDNVTSSLMFFILDRPKDISTITYRVIIDGLWTTDPINPQKKYDQKSGLTLSFLDLGGTLPKITGTEKTNCVKFIYNGKTGQTVRLGGSFTNWDSRIYELTETREGFYEIDLPLPTGKHYYNYYLGMTAITDKTNPNKAYTPDGRIASVIVVD